MTKAETDKLIQAKLAEGVALLNELVVAQMKAAVIAAGGLANPSAAAVLDAEHARMLKWHAETMATLESALLRATGGRLQ
jgi:hypothetical protein